MRTAFDMSSVMWTSLMAGKDPEAQLVMFEDKEVSVNSASWGYENAVNLIVSALEDAEATPEDMIMVFEAASSKKRRLMISSDYKGTRDSRPPEAYEQFNLLKEQLKSVFGSLGALSISHDFVEGDDVLGWLADNTEEPLMIVTNDNDMSVCNKTNKYGAVVVVRIGGVIGENKYGPFPFPLVTLYKSLVGDTKDNIKGVKGFGSKSFEALLIKYGEDGAYELMEAVANHTVDDLQDLDSCKLMKKILDEKESFYKSYALASLHPEWINTMQTQMVWEPGMVLGTVTDERLKHWGAKHRLVTAANYERSLADFQRHAPRSADIVFDIETSTPDESDDWLAAQGDPNGVDVLGSQLTGFSLTFGDNHQYTYYVSVNHRDTKNISMKQARLMLEAIPADKELIIQNTSFEGSVLFQAEDEDGKWSELWKDNGYHGFLRNWLDTKLEASYVDENSRTGLKERSLNLLKYRQVTYAETTSKSGKESELPSGGRVVKEWVNPEGDLLVTKQYKMRELTAAEVAAYGMDDTICTSALHNFYKLHMQLEHHYHVYLTTEISASYLHAKNFVDGMAFSLGRMNQLKAEDDKTYDTAWAVLRKYLITHGWEGTVPPSYDASITAAQIKEAFRIVHAVADADEVEIEDEDPADARPKTPEETFLSTRVRTPSKLLALLKDQGFDVFAERLEACLAGRGDLFTKWVLTFFKGEPNFSISNKQLQNLLYTVMALPVRIYNKPTKAMEARGLRLGTPKTDALAIAYALNDADVEQTEVLQALRLLQMVKTRRSLYYTTYPYFIHWKTGRIHSSHNQCQTNTRRASESKPNKQQLPKHPKIEGQLAKFRETVVPHKPGAVVVSLDFEQQELRIIADYSRDPNMLACYVGDSKKDMHVLTALGIAQYRKLGGVEWSYDAYIDGLGDKNNLLHKELKEMRALGKKVNFTTEFGAAAPKLAQTLMVSEADAQVFIKAKEAAFPDVVKWKEREVAEAKRCGYQTTMLGARRHLQPMLMSRDPYERSKAERQAVNFKVQSSGAEMTKRAEGRMWEIGLYQRYDAVCYGPIHDEIVSSVMIEDLLPFLIEKHACMVAPYGNMQVPITSSISLGFNFGIQFELGTSPTAEAVADGMAQCAKWKEEQHAN